MATSDSIAVHIDPDFQSLIPPLSPEERMQLEENLLRDGCRDPLVTWNGVLLDGHNRFEICQAHGLYFDTVAIALTDRDAAADWIDTNQLGRRNLTPDQQSLLRGRRYKRATKQGERNDLTSRQSGDKLIDWEAAQKPFITTAEILARKHGVSPRTIERDGQFADAVETLKPHVPDIEQRVMSGDVPSKQAVVEAAKEPEKAVEILGKPHVSHNTGNNEWYTPPQFIKAARDAMGGITLDPASSRFANTLVGAESFYTIDDDGLTKPWRGSVWMNPPYSQPLIAQFAEAVRDKYTSKEIKRACVLVNNATETGWFQTLLSVTSAICFLRGRIKYLDAEGNPANTPLQGQAILYLGENPHRFARSFAELGTAKVFE